MPAALEGLVVLDLSADVAGQYCARMLCDYGATVTLVEPPGGSPTRHRGPWRAPPDAHESLLFFHLNHGKRLETIARDTPSGRDRLAALAAGADAIVVGRGEDRAALRAAAPGAIVCLLSDFGETGPLAHWKGSELVHQALSGNMNQNGDPDRAPLYGCGERASYCAGVAGAIALLAAWIARPPGGPGQDVEVDVAETAASLWYPYATQYLYNGSLEVRGDERQPLGYVRCRDDWIAFWVYNDRWDAFCDVMGAPMLARDPRFEDPGERIARWNELLERLGELARDRGADELVAALQAAHLVAARSHRPSALGDACEHLRVREYWERIDWEGRRRPILGPQFRMSRTPRAVGRLPDGRRRAPEPPAPGTPDAAPGPRPAAGATNGGPLAGLRIVDVTTAFAGPMAGRILAFLGAEVVHVESASRPDLWRHHNQVFNERRYPDGRLGTHRWNRCALFNTENVNKLSLAVDLKRPGGVDVLRRLMLASDAVICNFRPGTLARSGLGYEDIARSNPGVVYVEMPAFGNTGPMADSTALAPTMELVAGMSSMVGYPDRRPVTTGPAYLDAIGGLHGAAACLIALAHRARTGHGQYVEVPQCEAAMQMIGEVILAAIETGVDPGLSGNDRAGCLPHGPFPAAGADAWVAIAVTDDAEWAALARAIDRPELAADARFATLGARVANRAAIDAIVSAWTAARDKHDAAERLQRAGVPAAPVQDARDLVNSAYLAGRGFFTVLDHPEAGRHPYPGLPFHLSRTPGSQYRAAPCLGEHGERILRDVLGLDDAGIESLRRSGTLDADATWPPRTRPAAPGPLPASGERR